MSFSRRRSIALAASVLTVFTVRSASAIIINGPAGGGVVTSGWDGVGTVNNGLGSATGVLIDPLHVLAAAHEVFNPNTNVAFPASAVSFKLSGSPVFASKITLAPGYQGVFNPSTNGSTTDYTTSDLADLAIITLSSPITNATTWGYNTSSLVETAAGTASIVGLGDGGDGTTGDNSYPTGPYPFGTKRLGNNAIDLVATNLSGTTVTDQSSKHYVLPHGVIVWDFDQVGAGNGPLGGAAVSSTEGDSAIGDSGSPVFQFDPASNKFIVTGIAIDGTNNTTFGEISWATQTSAYASFITANTPEPTSLGAIVLGAGMLLARRRRV